MDNSSSVGSPDSGIVTSPVDISSDCDFDKVRFIKNEIMFSAGNTNKEFNKGKRKHSISFCEPTNKKATSFSRTIVELKEDKAKKNTKAISLTKSFKRKKVVKKGQIDLVENSPVLGIRILPETHLQTNLLDENTDKKLEASSSSNYGSKSSEFVCRLCYQAHKDAVSLARHKCVRIINERYCCPECGKSFACPANLASHRRWHRPNERVTAEAVYQEEKRTEIFPSSSTKTNRIANNFKLVQKDSVEKKIIDLTTDISSGNESEENVIQAKFKKSTYPCPFCKRCFQRKLNRKKHISLKHGIETASEFSDTEKNITVSPSVVTNIANGRTLAQQTNKNAPSFQPFENVSQLMVLNNSQTASSQKSAEKMFLNSNDEAPSLVIISAAKNNGTAATLSINSDAEKQVEQDFNQPLDLSLKKHQRKNVCHSIEEIMKPSVQLEPVKSSRCGPGLIPQIVFPCVLEQHLMPYSTGNYYSLCSSTSRVFPVVTQHSFIRRDSEEFLQRLSYMNRIRYVAPNAHNL